MNNIIKYFSVLFLNSKIICGYSLCGVIVSKMCFTNIDLCRGAAILILFLIDISVTEPSLEEQNSLVPICKMIITIFYCYLIEGT